MSCVRRGVGGREVAGLLGGYSPLGAILVYMVGTHAPSVNRMTDRKRYLPETTVAGGKY